MVKLHTFKTAFPPSSSSSSSSSTSSTSTSTTTTTTTTSVNNNKEDLPVANRFRENSYDRSVFDREECTYKLKGECICLECCKEPLVVIDSLDNEKSESICYEYNITLRNVREFIDGGIIESICNEKSLLIYSQTENNRTQIGVCAAISIQDCLNGTLKRHELTIQGQDKPIFNNKQRKQFKPKCVDPIMVMYRQNCVIDEIVNRIIRDEQPCVDCKKMIECEDSKYSTHKIWIVKNDNDIENLSNAFDTVQSLYVADGHHRTADACRIASENKGNPYKQSMYIMAILFPHNQLSLVPFNRYIRNIDLPLDVFFERVSQSFNVIEGGISDNVGNQSSIRMYVDGKWYELETLDRIDINTDDPMSSIDSQILCDHLLKPALGIVSPSLDRRIGYLSGSGSDSLSKLTELVDNGIATVAFAIKSISVEEIMNIADSGQLLPPKASCFEPKPLKGLLVRLH